MPAVNPARLGKDYPMLPTSMFAMIVDPVSHRLMPVQKSPPKIGSREIPVKVLACGVCRTDLHLIDADLPAHRFDVVPGHEVVGEVVARGAGAMKFEIGARIGIFWLGRTCGHCEYCLTGRENLCDTRNSPEMTAMVGTLNTPLLANNFAWRFRSPTTTHMLRRCYVRV